MKWLLTALLSLQIVFFSFNTSAQSNTQFIKGDVIVQLFASEGARGLISRAPENYDLKINRQLSKIANIWLFNFDSLAIPQMTVLDWLRSQPEVELAQNNYLLELRSTIPNESTLANFDDQWHHVNTGQTNGTVDADIDSDLAWDITTGGTTASGHDIVICLIESGNLDHQDLDPNRWFNANEIPNNGVDDDGNGFTDDYNGWNPVQGNDDYGTGGHGTNCLGMMGAKGNNGLNVVGANWDVKLMVVGGYNISTDANAIEAYEYPLTMRQIWNSTGGTSGAFVVATSSSWGIDQEDPNNHPVWCNYYTTMGQSGILNVGATTNGNFDVDVVGDMPTACNTPYMIGVGRTDHNDNTAGGYGDQTIELGAPGINVVTTANTNTITTTTGTSFSCPLTAGVIGLAYSIPCSDFMDIVISDPQAGADMVLQALLDGTDVIPAFANKFVTSGRLNSRGTLDQLMAVACSGSVCLAPSSVSATNINENTADLSFSSFNGSDSTMVYWREVGAPSWTTVSNASSPVNLTGLLPCTEYEFYMESYCAGSPSNPSSTQTFTTIGCGACIDLSYCTSGGSNDEEFIDVFTLDGTTNSSGPDGGYGNYTGLTAFPLMTNNTYNFTMTPGWQGTQYDEYTRIWIDLDQSGTFEPAELLFDQGASSQAVVNGSISIPGTATLGVTRMRVYMAWDNAPLPTECDSYTYGETEDYCVEILPDVICGLTVTESVNEPTCVGIDDGDISINVSGGSGNYSFDWGAQGTLQNISNLGEGTFTLVVTDVTAGCDTTIDYSLNYSTVLNITISGTDASCNGAMDGQAVASTTGGTGYTYQWQSGPASDTYTSIGAGVYTVDVTDNATGCMAAQSVTINEPPADAASFTSNAVFLDVTFTNTSTPGTYLWEFGDGNTSATTNPTHNYASDGTYQVCLTVTSSCGSDSTCTMITINGDNSGIAENIASYVNVYPNPAKNILNFEVTYTGLQTIEILDVVGKVIYREMIENEITTIQVNNLNDGTYFYRILDNKGNSVINDRLIIVK